MYLNCEHCGREFLSPVEGQRWCSNNCRSKWYFKRHEQNIYTETLYIICAVCASLFTSNNKTHRTCSRTCQVKNYYGSGRKKGAWDRTEKRHKLPCLQCKQWVVNPESENGGWCKLGRWRICKPYMPNAEPFDPEERYELKRSLRKNRK